LRALAARPAGAVDKRAGLTRSNCGTPKLGGRTWTSANWTAAGPGLTAADKPDKRGESSSSLTEGHN